MSTQKLPTFRVRTLEPIGVELFFQFPELQDTEKSYFEADLAAGQTTISAKGLNFAADDYIVLGQIGFEGTELVKVASVSATTIGLASATLYPHNRGDQIKFIPYNQIALDSSPDGINFSNLGNINIDVNAKEVYGWRPTDAVTTYYRFRFYNAVLALYSSYSDIVSGEGYADNTVYSIKKRALNDLGDKVDDLLTDEWLNEALREGRRLVDMDPRIFRWSFRTKFNTDIGNIIPGMWSITAPTDLRNRNSNLNILQLRVARDSQPLEYQDNYSFRQNYEDIPHTTLNGNVLAGATSIVLTSSGDFEDTGNITIGAETVLLTNDIASYTTNNKSTNVIGGVSGVEAHTSGTDVWQDATFGLPRYYTIDNGEIYFDVPFSDEYAGENIFMDYYTALTELTTDAQTLDENFYDLYVSYLKYKIKAKKSNGKLDRATDSDYIDFTEGITRLIVQEISGQKMRFQPS